MEFIRHRINTLEDLATVAPNHGAEIDLRSRGDKIILAHEPFTDGLELEAFLKSWSAPGQKRGTLILNPKEDGLESRTIALMTSLGIHKYFFLDLTIPTTVRLSTKEGFRKIAVRMSEYEKFESALSFKNQVAWVWLDCFSGKPAWKDNVDALKGTGFLVCLVSPELQGYPVERIADFQELGSMVDAVCTKRPDLWGKR